MARAMPFARACALVFTAASTCLLAEGASNHTALRGAVAEAASVSTSNSSGNGSTAAFSASDSSGNSSAAASKPLVDLSLEEANLTASAASASGWWGWHHALAGETCCMCQVNMGWQGTILYSAEDYSHFFGSHTAMWQCQWECPRKCGSNWHHGQYFGCFQERELIDMDRRYGHMSGYQLAYGRFGGLC